MAQSSGVVEEFDMTEANWREGGEKKRGRSSLDVERG